MRRREKEIKDWDAISGIIRDSKVCRLGLAMNNAPYVVPVSFGYDGDAIYFHTAKEGKKIEYIEANNSVCFEFEAEVRIIPDEVSPCKWSFSFQSVIGYGKIHELVEEGEKIGGLDLIMKQYSDKKWRIDENKLNPVRVWKITIDSLTGKQSKGLGFTQNSACPETH